MLFALATAALAVDLNIAGGCPGTTIMSVSGATPSSSVRLISGSGVGADVVSTDGCVVSTGLSGAVVRTSGVSDAAGTKQFAPSLGGGACGMFMVALDTATCSVSAVDQIPLAGHAPGPDFSADGYVQCAGYYDTAAGSEIPTAWAPDCQGASDNKIRLVCGRDDSSFRYIDVNKNPFRDGLLSYPEHGIITGSNFALTSNDIYATGNDPDVAVSWWQTGDGCNEFAMNVTMNNVCTWEASNCFGQGLTGNRYLWVYTKP